MIHVEKKDSEKKNQILRQKRKGNVSSFRTYIILLEWRLRVSVKTMCIGV